MEDTILAKTRWLGIAEGSSEHQWDDVQALLAIHRGTLNMRYMNYWAEQLGIAELFAGVLRGERPWPSDDEPQQMRLF